MPWWYVDGRGSKTRDKFKQKYRGKIAGEVTRLVRDRPPQVTYVTRSKFFGDVQTRIEVAAELFRKHRYRLINQDQSQAMNTGATGPVVGGVRQGQFEDFQGIESALGASGSITVPVRSGRV